MLQIGNVPQICASAFNAVAQPVCGAWNLFRPSNDAASSYSSRMPAAAALAATLGGCTDGQIAAGVLTSIILICVGALGRLSVSAAAQAQNSEVKAREIEGRFKRMIEEGHYLSAYESAAKGDGVDNKLRVGDPQEFVGKDIAFVAHTKVLLLRPAKSEIVQGRCVEVQRKNDGVYLVIEEAPEFVRSRVRLSVGGYEVTGFEYDGVPDHRYSTVYYRDSKPAA